MCFTSRSIFYFIYKKWKNNNTNFVQMIILNLLYSIFLDYNIFHKWNDIFMWTQHIFEVSLKLMIKHICNFMLKLSNATMWTKYVTLPCFTRVCKNCLYNNNSRGDKYALFLSLANTGIYRGHQCCFKVALSWVFLRRLLCKDFIINLYTY
jgi:hypothetical protein